VAVAVAAVAAGVDAVLYAAAVETKNQMKKLLELVNTLGCHSG